MLATIWRHEDTETYAEWPLGWNLSETADSDIVATSDAKTVEEAEHAIRKAAEGSPVKVTIEEGV